MKLVVAIIKPHQVEAVTSALDNIEVSGMTLTEVQMLLRAATWSSSGSMSN